MATEPESEILFGGPGAYGATVPDVAAPRDGGIVVPGARPSWPRLLEEAFAQLTSDPQMRELYGDPNRGATLLQSWRTAQLFGSPPLACLLNSTQPRISAAGITTLVLVPADELVSLVSRALLHRVRSSVQLFVFDGAAGHSITAQAADPDASGITFHDPWPGDSLLSQGYNQAGVAAQRRDDSWHITAAELEKVVAAAFISPAVWATLCGRPGLPTYDQLQQTEYWKFFNVHEVGRDDADPTYITVYLEPGGFKEHIAMEIICYETGEICDARLRLRESWAIGPPMGINPLAKDLARSWLDAGVPAADREAVGPLVDELSGIALDAKFKAKADDPAWCNSSPGLLVLAYLGLGSDGFATAFSQSFLRVETEADQDGTKWTAMSLSMG